MVEQQSSQTEEFSLERIATSLSKNYCFDELRVLTPTEYDEEVKQLLDDIQTRAYKGQKIVDSRKNNVAYFGHEGNGDKWTKYLIHKSEVDSKINMITIASFNEEATYVLGFVEKEQGSRYDVFGMVLNPHEKRLEEAFVAHCNASNCPSIAGSNNAFIQGYLRDMQMIITEQNAGTGYTSHKKTA